MSEYYAARGGQRARSPEGSKVSEKWVGEHALAAHPFGLTPRQWNELLENGRAADEDPDFDSRPVVKLHRSDGSIQLLLAEVKPACRDLAFGLAQLETGPLLRFTSLSALAAEEHGKLYAADYQSDFTLTEAALSAQREGKIRDYAAEPCPLCDRSIGPASEAGFSRVRLRPQQKHDAGS